MSLMLTAFTARGVTLALRIAEALGEGTVFAPQRLCREGVQGYASLSQWTGEQFAAKNSLLFVSAAGIAVRAVAPYLRDKLSDPPVVSVDEGGRFVVPLVSGHVGGGNALARQVAEAIGGIAVISTATDVNGLFAVDEWAARQGMPITDRAAAKGLSAALLDEQEISFTSEFPYETLPKNVRFGGNLPGFAVTCRTADYFPAGTLVLHPKWLTVGIGCRKNLPPERVGETVAAVLNEHHLAAESVGCLASVELKREDEGIHALARKWGVPVRFYSPEALMAAEGNFTPSAFVQKTTGADNICERSAVLASGGGTLLVPKTARGGVTVAVARRNETISFEEDKQ